MTDQEITKERLVVADNEKRSIQVYNQQTYYKVLEIIEKVEKKENLLIIEL